MNKQELYHFTGGRLTPAFENQQADVSAENVPLLDPPPLHVMILTPADSIEGNLFAGQDVNAEALGRPEFQGDEKR